MRRGAAWAAAIAFVLALVGGLKHQRNSASLSTEEIAGIARVTDGDTLTIGRTKIRLAGIDAPEIGQECQAEGQAYQCGQRAAIALDELLRSRTDHTVHCRPAGQDRYQRVLARCLVDDVDVNGWMVEQGWAVAYRRFSDEYVGQENRARAARRGIWAGQFDNPEDFRHGRVARVPGRSAQRSGGLIPATPADAETKR